MTDQIVISHLSSKSILLVIDEQKILVNCDSNSEMPENVDYVLITANGMEYIGGLPSLKNFKKIYSTSPVSDLGKLEVDEFFENKSFFYKEDIKETDVFNKITAVKYLQPIILGNITIEAYNGGHSIGNAIWKISYKEENYVCFIDVNYKNELHIDGLDFEIFNEKCNLILNSNYMQEPFNASQLHDILSYKKGKIIFIISYMRLLELLMLLTDKKIKKKIVCVFFNGHKFSDYTATFLEYAGEMAMNRLTTSKDNPFIFDNIHFDSNCTVDGDIFIVNDYRSGYLPILLNRYKKFENKIIHCEQQILIKNIFQNEFIDLPKINLVEEKIEREISTHSEEIVEEEIVPVEEDIKDYRSQQYGKKFFLPVQANNIEKKVQGNKEEQEILINEKRTVSFSKVKNQFNYTEEYLNLNGLPNILSLKNILSNLRIERVIVFGLEEERNFISNLLFFENSYVVVELINTVQLDLLNKFKRIQLSNEIINELDNQNVCAIRCENQEDSLTGEKIDFNRFYGKINLDVLRKILIENNLNVEEREDILIVNKQLKIIFNEGMIVFRGEMNELYFSIKKILFSYVISL